jgi:hypothetical protein
MNGHTPGQTSVGVLVGTTPFRIVAFRQSLSWLSLRGLVQGAYVR